ncbi:MAG: transporter permease, partial [Haloplasmataceae bacterium]|nr:transporter permease [Haloplasmataceae bacterium]
FMQNVLPNTFKFVLIVGPGGYLLSFFLAWTLAQIPHRPRTILAIILYSPSMTLGFAMSVVWTILFSGDSTGYLNSFLLNNSFITEPIQWLQSPEYLMPIMIIVSLWSSMGVGFLAMLSGVLNIDPELYEAAYIDGIKSKLQEIFYITIPAMKPQMLFGAVMAAVNTFQAGSIGIQLSGSNPTPQNAGQLFVNHIDDYGFIRYEMGYAAAVSVILLLIVYGTSKLAWRLFGEKE